MKTIILFMAFLNVILVCAVVILFSRAKTTRAEKALVALMIVTAISVVTTTGVLCLPYCEICDAFGSCIHLGGA